VGLEVFIKNATNTDELTWLDSVFAGTDARASRLRPRTIGLSVGYQF
jgi:outer membrane receptor protein involved in Fe transport